MYTQEDKLKAAYALNLCTVSVSQIIDYNDINILEQEYENILNNLNLEQIPKDDALLEILRKILDVITFFRISEGDKAMIDFEYQHKIKNALWSAVPNMGMIFASDNPISMVVTLASQVGIGYMNYRRNKADYQLEKDKEYWQLRRAAIEQLKGLQTELFTSAWRLAGEYDFPDEYRLTISQIKEYNQILMEENPIKRYNRLDAMRNQFAAYPQFWYQIGSTANSIYRSNRAELGDEIKNVYRGHALDCFERYYDLNKFNILRHDVLTSSWALEYIDLLDLSDSAERKKAKELAGIAEKHSGNAKDVLELCAYAQLKLGDHQNAARLFKTLVNADYNADVNARILSGLYIQKSRKAETRTEALAEYQMLTMITNRNYILPMPDPEAPWLPEWDKHEDTQEEAASDRSKFEEVTINNITHISKGETITYKEKIIHFQAMINCEGTLEFDSCVLHYSETDTADEIKLTNDASLTMRQCVVINHGYDKAAFIDAERTEKPLNFYQCEFVDCCWFISARASSIHMEGCKIINFGENFISSSWGDISLVDCKFLSLQRPAFFPENDEEDIIYGDTITVSNCIVRGTTEINSAEEGEELSQNHNARYFIHARKSLISESSFLGMQNIVRTDSCEISRSTFEHCFHMIQGWGAISIGDCRFDHCSKIGVNLEKGSRIMNCQFNQCYGALFDTSYEGGVDFRFCEFNNWSAVQEQKQIAAFWSGAMIEFRRSRKNGAVNTVENCVFRGIRAYQFFLLKGRISGKINGNVLMVSNCSFQDCTTSRSSGKLIREHDTYYGAFNSQHELKIASISECRGLDQVNQSSDQVANIAPKTKTSDGAAIGAIEKAESPELIAVKKVAYRIIEKY